MKKLDDHSTFKMIILGLMLSICTLTTYYFHFILKTEVIFTHLFYIPIILASLWWSRKGVVVGLFLALMLVISNFMNPDMPYIWSDVVRGVMFVFVGRLVDALILRNLILIDSLNRSQEYQNKLINNSNALIVVWDPNIRITCVNQAFEHITGYTADEVNGKEICILFSKATQKESLKKIECTLNSGYMEAVEIPFTCKDGATRLMLCNLANVYEEDGTTVLSTIAQCIDITERRRAVEALRKEKEFSENLVQTSPTFFVAINSNDKIIMMNNAMLQALGYTMKEVVDKDYMITVVPESDRPMLSKVFDEIISSRKPTLNENLVLTKDGREILVEWHGRPVFKENGEFDFFFGVGIDITERKRVEEAIQKYTEELVHSNELKDLFTDILRHDLLNPAGIVKGYTEVLLDLEDNKEKLKSLQAIERNIERLIDMIESASKFAKLESVEQLEFIDMDIGIIFKEVVEDFGPNLNEKKMLLEFAAGVSYPANVNPVIEEVFSNLISNAIKYSPEGSRIIVDILDDGDKWKVMVTDFGIGVSDKYKPRLFERFKRVERKGVKGTGLGLAIVKRIISLHGGSVGVEDNPAGQGSVFWVTVRKAF